MSRRITPFFATREDLIHVLREAMSVRPIELVSAGLLDERRLEMVAKPEDIKEFEIYLVVERGERMHVREVPQRRGPSKYNVNLAGDFNNVALNTGGKCGDGQLLPGQLGTISNDARYHERYSFIAKIIRKRFEKIHSRYVGPEAAAMLDGGARLSISAKSPPEYDLVRAD